MGDSRFHHINVMASDLHKMEIFYKNILDLEETTLPRMLEKYSLPASILTDGENQFHLSEMDPSLGRTTGHFVNPVLNGHTAFRVSDLEAVKRRLMTHGVPYSDYGEWAVKGWHQVYFYDPEGNVVEVHQVIE